jgi:hypothetical protein
MAGRLLRRATVEGHERRRHAWDSDDLGAPPVGGNRRNLDQVLSPANDFLVTVNVQVTVLEKKGW